jgi:hypothetical protein
VLRVREFGSLLKCPAPERIVSLSPILLRTGLVRTPSASRAAAPAAVTQSPADLIFGRTSCGTRSHLRSAGGRRYDGAREDQGSLQVPIRQGQHGLPISCSCHSPEGRAVGQYRHRGRSPQSHGEDRWLEDQALRSLLSLPSTGVRRCRLS